MRGGSDFGPLFKLWMLLRTVGLYVFSPDRDKRRLFVELLALARRGTVSFDKAVAVMVALEGFHRHAALLHRYRTIIEHTPVGKAKMFLALSKYYKDRGDYEKAAAYYRRLGYIKHWWVIGGWENQKMRQYYEVAPPETTTFRPDTSFVLRDSLTAAWTRIDRLGDYRQSIDLRNVLVKTKYSVAYMLTFLHADSACDALMFYGSDDGVKVWCNDSLVHKKKVYRAIYIDDDVFRLRLRKGVNKLLVKVLQDVGGWGLSPRVVGADGEAIPGVRVSYADTRSVP
jgi:hypothetical protein